LTNSLSSSSHFGIHYQCPDTRPRLRTSHNGWIVERGGGHLDLAQRTYLLPHSLLVSIVLIQTLLQDLCSFNKEQADGDYQNFICVLMHERGLDLQGAVYALTNMIAQRVRDYARLKASLPSFGAEVDVELAKYLAELEHETYASVRWYYESPSESRYFLPSPLWCILMTTLRILERKRGNPSRTRHRGLPPQTISINIININITYSSRSPSPPARPITRSVPYGALLYHLYQQYHRTLYSTILLVFHHQPVLLFQMFSGHIDERITHEIMNVIPKIQYE
jgi:hypothetical protein